jgi:hypothetical protein
MHDCKRNAGATKTAAHSRKTVPRKHYSTQRLKSNEALVPPKPKEFDSA